MKSTALLAFEDGKIFYGDAFGAEKTVVGEAVFNTSMTGYQEILTDPSYFAQIVTMTAPQVGNYGINAFDTESDCPSVAGFVIRELSPISSNWRSQGHLSNYLKSFGIPGISEVDTRLIAKKLRVQGAMACCLSTEGISAEEVLNRARSWPGLEGIDYVKQVSCKKPYRCALDNEAYRPFSIEGTSLEKEKKHLKRYRIIAYDFGMKRNILRKLIQHGFDVEIVPAETPAEYVKEKNPDGLFLSNGPGDPAALGYAHKIVSQLITHYPTFGICLGHQIITHALGAETFKLKFGHRGGNQPVKNLETGLVSITAQNHGFASTPNMLEKCGAIVTEVNLNDNTVEGLRHKDLPVFSVQYHPESAPGPHDADPLFEMFYQKVAHHA